MSVVPYLTVQKLLECQSPEEIIDTIGDVGNDDIVQPEDSNAEIVRKLDKKIAELEGLTEKVGPNPLVQIMVTELKRVRSAYAVRARRRHLGDG